MRLPQILLSPLIFLRLRPRLTRPDDGLGVRNPTKELYETYESLTHATYHFNQLTIVSGIHVEVSQTMKRV